MIIETFFAWLELLAGIVLLFISVWAFMSFRLKTFKKAFKISIIASVFLINASFFASQENELISKALISIAAFLLSISFALLINSAKDIGLGK